MHNNDFFLNCYPKLVGTPGIQSNITFIINFQDSTQLVRIWQRDDGNVIFTGAVKVSRQENHQLDNTTLVISDAQPHDAGGYTCRVMIRARDELSVTHRLIVNTQSFHISPVNSLDFQQFFLLCKNLISCFRIHPRGSWFWRKDEMPL